MASREESSRQRGRQDIGGIDAPVHLHTAISMQLVLHCHLDLALFGGLRFIRGGMLLRCTTGSIRDLLCIEVLTSSLQVDPSSEHWKMGRPSRHMRRMLPSGPQ